LLRTARRVVLRYGFDTLPQALETVFGGQYPIGISKSGFQLLSKEFEIERPVWTIVWRCQIVGFPPIERCAAEMPGCPDYFSIIVFKERPT
jgi:hypothetical protein